MGKLDQAAAANFKQSDLPYVIGIMRAHKILCDRGEYTDDQRILNSVFVGSLAASRMLLEFLGVGRNRSTGELVRPKPEKDSVTAEDLGSSLVDLDVLNADDVKRDLLSGLIWMAHKSSGHITVPDKRPWEHFHEAVTEVEAHLKQKGLL